ncbi:L-histidine N(alpha)-methyltransferase [Tomitella fengzijianii]|uniref:Histidine N-alpha-methyltransferase n=1 Tax=Tomitella fengzijianii TaxID=2597660 RepID=A0A516X222_9ACTN|nr:L-histidine N(alpha)-methyltransferase [Tomitella fengzijianii]QDQ97070.1 L-histidine N(alpha)-methyltransferase [Tomitella fengzijianii]
MTTTLVDVHLTEADLEAQLRADVVAGLAAVPKSLPPKWFYDQRGGELFDAITRLPEYYPTRTERALLTRAAPEIAAASKATTLVELGSGSSEKTRLLLTAFAEHEGLEMYVPQDVSESSIRFAADALAIEFPDLPVRGVVGDFTDTTATLPRAGHRLVAFLGGTIGNLEPDARAAFLHGVAEALDPGECLLVGIGLVTDPAVMIAAYDDEEGVTAEFNRNVLHVLNRRLGADFDPRMFEHVALWDAAHSWIEMRLRARREMQVRIPAVGTVVDFAAGEELRTEVSAKFMLDGFGGELTAAGFDPAHTWTDEASRFALVLARRRG